MISNKLDDVDYNVGNYGASNNNAKSIISLAKKYKCTKSNTVKPSKTTDKIISSNIQPIKPVNINKPE